jgi:hypothetical protein
VIDVTPPAFRVARSARVRKVGGANPFAEVDMLHPARVAASCVWALVFSCGEPVTDTGVAADARGDLPDAVAVDAGRDARFGDGSPDVAPPAADGASDSGPDAAGWTDAGPDAAPDGSAPDAGELPGAVAQIGGPGEERLGSLQVWWNGSISGPPFYICSGWLLAGGLSAGAVFAEGTPFEVTPSSVGGLDAFFAAFWETTLHWVRTDGGPGDDIAVGLAGAAPNGAGRPEVHVVGTFGGNAEAATATFDAREPVSLTSRGGRDVYWARYTSEDRLRVPPTLEAVSHGGSLADDDLTSMSGRLVGHGAPARIVLEGVDFAGVFGGPSFMAPEWGTPLECVEGAGAFAVAARTPGAAGPPIALSGGCDVEPTLVRQLEDGMLVAGDFGPDGTLLLGEERIELAPRHLGGRNGFVHRSREGARWTFTVGGSGDALVTDVCAFDGGGIFGFTVVGSFSGDATFGSDPVSARTASARGVDGFIVDLSADGALLDFVQLGGAGDQRALHCSSGGVVGTFGGTLEVTGVARPLTATSDSDAFLIGRNTEIEVGGPSRLTHFVAGKTGALAFQCTGMGGAGVHNCCVYAGEFRGDVTLFPGTAEAAALSSRGGTDLFTLYVGD